MCDKVFIWNPSNCECECDKSCDIDEYLDYENCKCRKKLAHPLIEECTEIINETKLVRETSTELHWDKNENKDKCKYIRYYFVYF